ncbi:MAG TPA: hypothetical protein VHX12_00910 [Acidisoma sp.]|nr:hypothetical protein [Acidisoma sp.]
MMNPAVNGLSDATILIVRHAEKPADGTGLSPAGEMRAQVYANYFQDFSMSGMPAQITELVAAEDSDKSDRPRLTLEPLSAETGMVINQPCPDHAVKTLVAWLKTRPAHQTTLVSWHHTKIGKLLAALGADPEQLLPNGHWPNDSFDWVVALRFDREGKLIPGSAHVIHEPAAVDNVVWSVMDHPTISPMRQAPLETLAAR